MIEKGLIGKQDVSGGTSTFNRKGRTGFDVTIDQLSASDLPLRSYATADLPTDGSVNLAYVTDGIRGLWRRVGSQWMSVTGHADVRDFGAKGDGTTDDYAAIAAAIAATPGGGRLYVPRTSAYYRLTDTLVITTAITIYGDGWRFGQSSVNGSILRQEGGVTKDVIKLDGNTAEIDGMYIHDIVLGGTAQSRYALNIDGDPNLGTNRSFFSNILLAGAGTSCMRTSGLCVLNNFLNIKISMAFTTPAGYANPTYGFELNGSCGNNAWTGCAAAGVTTGVGYGWYLNGTDGNLFNFCEAEGNNYGWYFNGTAGGNIFIQPYHEASVVAEVGGSCSTAATATNLSIGSTQGASTLLTFPSTIGATIVTSASGIYQVRGNFVAGGTPLSPFNTAGTAYGGIHAVKTGVTNVWNTAATEGGIPLFVHTDTNLANVTMAELQATGALADSTLKIGSSSANLGDVGLAALKRSTGSPRNIYIKRLTTDVIATASLPAAAASEDGRVIVEDAGAGDRNLIIYAGGQRFRIDGGAAF